MRWVVGGSQHGMMLAVTIILGLATVGLLASHPAVNGERETSDDKSPSVRTPLGSIRGFWQVSRNGRRFQAYEGIPYARPPVGKLRFEAPRPIVPWTGRLPATKPGPVCLQYLQIFKDPNERVTGAEDCLYLNVYTPVRQNKSGPTGNTDTGISLPVMVYIHSGAFQFGDGATHQPHYLMDKDVILVTFNYRLGPLGFLSTEDEVVPGNMGLKDQRLALVWVSENIEWFGGDPHRVTLFGLSAGAASVHYHYLSPMSRGLFQRGMSVSGTALDCWTQTEASLDKAKKLAAIMGCPTTINNREMVRCLKSRPAKSILEAEPQFMDWLYNPFTPFGPVVEKNPGGNNGKGGGAFIDKSPIEIITRGEAADLPWITSVVSEEGLYPAAEFITDKRRVQQLDENWDAIAPHLLDFNYTLPRSEHVRVARKIREHYLGKRPIERLTAKALIHMIGDRHFVIDAEKAARLLAKVNESPVRFYVFTYRGEHSLSDLFTGTKENLGVSHADDVSYVFKNFQGPLTDDQDLEMSRDMINLWTSYATTGSPKTGVEWPPVDPSEQSLNYLHISGPSRFSVESNANLGEKDFWNSIDFNENRLSPRDTVAQPRGQRRWSSSERKHRESREIPPSGLLEDPGWACAH